MVLPQLMILQRDVPIPTWGFTLDACLCACDVHSLVYVIQNFSLSQDRCLEAPLLEIALHRVLFMATAAETLSG